MLTTMFALVILGYRRAYLQEEDLKAACLFRVLHHALYSVIPHRWTMWLGDSSCQSASKLEL